MELLENTDDISYVPEKYVELTAEQHAQNFKLILEFLEHIEELPGGKFIVKD